MSVLEGKLDSEIKKRIVSEELARIDEQLFRIEVTLVANQNNPDFAVRNGNPISEQEAMVKARTTLANMRVDLLKRYEPLLGTPKGPRKVAAPPAEEEPEAVLNLPRRPARKR